MITLIVAVGIALVISAGCSLLEAVVYSIPMGGRRRPWPDRRESAGFPETSGVILTGPLPPSLP